MELRQLKYFVTVAATLNFSEASKRLFITQGTLSQQIKQLEDEMGAALFDRTSHSVVLTEAGMELLPIAKKTLEDSTECKNRMNDLRNGLGGTLNIGVTHSFTSLLTASVKNFIREYPNVKLKIFYETAAELIEQLREKQVDFILAFKPVNAYEDVETEKLFSTRLSAVVRKTHPLATHKSIHLQDIESYGVVLPGSGLQARRIFERFVGIDTRTLNVHLEINDPTLIMDIVQGTNLVAIVSSLAAYYRPDLVAVPIEDACVEMEGCIHRLRDGYRKKSAEAFISLLRDSAHIENLCREMEGWKQ